jgi:hypothetical protein
MRHASQTVKPAPLPPYTPIPLPPTARTGPREAY